MYHQNGLAIASGMVAAAALSYIFSAPAVLVGSLVLLFITIIHDAMSDKGGVCWSCRGARNVQCHVCHGTGRDNRAQSFHDSTRLRASMRNSVDGSPKP